MNALRIVGRSLGQAYPAISGYRQSSIFTKVMESSPGREMSASTSANPAVAAVLKLGRLNHVAIATPGKRISCLLMVFIKKLPFLLDLKKATAMYRYGSEKHS